MNLLISLDLSLFILPQSRSLESPSYAYINPKR